MAKKLSKLQLAQQKAESASKKTNQKINELGQHTGDLYASLTAIQALFDRIRNVPEENRLKYENLKAIRVNWKQQAEKIELEYKKAEVKAAGQGAAGVGAGVAVVTLGPTVAMGVATTFGVASTGTAISALSGAAATNAALAWLGGGALAAGGGGMAAGSAFLALAGPIGWTIAGLSIIASGLMFFKTKGDKERLENVYTLISNRDVKSYELAIVELSERIKRIIDETGKLEEAVIKIETFGTDYSQMTEEQQYELGAYVNLMEAATKLLVNPIYLIRNEREFHIYSFEDGERFEPDYVLFLQRDKTDGFEQLQIFIEPKGTQLLEKDAWKEKFLLQLRTEAVPATIFVDDNDYKIWGLHFFNQDNRMKEFDSEFAALIGK